MSLDQLRSRLEKEKAALAEKSGASCMFSETGPTSMMLMEEVIAVVESQQRDIDTLKGWLASLGGKPLPPIE